MVQMATFPDAKVEAPAAAACSDQIMLAVVRTLTGHRSSCLSVDFHPFGDFFASGSLDTSVKVWDVRRKACINTYKGHGRAVTSVKFSPDGRLLSSGGQDGELKVTLSKKPWSPQVAT